MVRKVHKTISCSMQILLLHGADYFRGEKCTPFTCKWTWMGAISHDIFICGEADRSGGGKCSCCCCCCWGTTFQSPMYSFLGCEMTKTLSQKGWEKAKTLSQKGCEKAKTLSKTVYIMVCWFVTNTIFHAADQWNDHFFVSLNFAFYRSTTRVGPWNRACNGRWENLTASHLCYTHPVQVTQCLLHSLQSKTIIWTN